MENILSWPPEEVLDHIFYLSLPLAHRKLAVSTATNSFWTAGWWPDVVLQMRSDPGVTVLEDEASTGCCWLTDSRSNRKETASQPDTDSSSVSSVTVFTSFNCSWKCRCFLSICLQSRSYNFAKYLFPLMFRFINNYFIHNCWYYRFKPIIELYFHCRLKKNKKRPLW